LLHGGQLVVVGGRGVAGRDVVPDEDRPVGVAEQPIDESLAFAVGGLVAIEYGHDLVPDEHAR
jgi:hypothetical protein